MSPGPYTGYVGMFSHIAKQSNCDGNTRAVQRGFVLPSPLMIVGGVALVFGITTLMFYNLYKGAVNDFANFKSSVEAVQESIRIENERKLKALAAINEDATRNWAKTAGELDRLRKRGGAIRVQPVRCAGTMPGLSATPIGLNGTPEESGAGSFRVITIDQCQTVANDAIDDAAKLYHLQEWVRGVGKVK